MTYYNSLIKELPLQGKEAVVKFMETIPEHITGSVREAIKCYFSCGYAAALMDKEKDSKNES